MGTNYYWMHNIPDKATLSNGKEIDNYFDDMDPDVHIGKTSYKGEENLTFTWAQNPDEVRSLCNHFNQGKIIYNEYNEQYTGEEFLKILNECKEEVTHFIGRRFC